jgi:hypothetical protein
LSQENISRRCCGSSMNLLITSMHRGLTMGGQTIPSACNHIQYNQKYVH